MKKITKFFLIITILLGSTMIFSSLNKSEASEIQYVTYEGASGTVGGVTFSWANGILTLNGTFSNTGTSSITAAVTVFTNVYVKDANYLLEVDYVSGTYTNTGENLPNILFYPMKIDGVVPAIQIPNLSLESQFHDEKAAYISPTTTASMMNRISFPASSSGTFDNLQLEVKVSYTPRTSYAVTYDSQGGTVVANNDVLIGEAIGTLPTTFRANYTFDGWYLEDTLLTKVADTYIPTSDLTLYAKWVAIPILPSGLNIYTYDLYDWTYTNTGERFYLSNNETINFDTTLITNPESSSVPTYFHVTGVTYFNQLVISAIGYPVEKFQLLSEPETTSFYFFRDDLNTVFYINNQRVEFTSDITNVEIYLENVDSEVAPETYVVSFISNGGSPVSSRYVNSGQVIVKPFNPTKTGYTFLGWYSDIQFTVEWDFTNNLITEDTTLYAAWEEETTSVEEPVSDNNSEILEFLKEYWIVVLLFLLGIAALSGKRR